jgi:predicted metalloenzyme YecM
MEPTMSGRSLIFAKRHVSNHSFRADNVAGGEMIILPFVSNGDTSAGVDAGDVDSGIDPRESNSTDDEEESDIVAEDEDEDDDELYLVLSRFPPQDESDTFVVFFGDGNDARIIRGDALDETSNRKQCPWKKFATSSSSADGGVGESCITDAEAFLSYLQENVPLFITSVLDELKMRYEMDLAMRQADHVCYRTGSILQYSTLVNSLRAATDDFRILTESVVGGRLISTFKLTTPITINTTDGNRIIDVIEIPSPKVGSPYHAGLEHVEFVIGDESQKSPMSSEAHHVALTDWICRYPAVSWSSKALDKVCNPDVSTRLGIPKYGTIAVKFHLLPLEDVIKFEDSSDK